VRATSSLSRNVVVLGIVSLLADVSGDMVVPLLPAFLVMLGAGASFLGVVEGVAEAVSALLKYLSGKWADRSRRLLPLATVGYALALVVRPLLAFAGAPWQVLVIRATDRVGKGIRTSPRDKLLAGSAPPERLAEAFSFHRGMDHLGATIGPLVAAGLLLLWPQDLRRVFLFAAIPGALALLAILLVREAEAAPPPPAAPSLPGAVPKGLLAAIGVFTLGNSTDALLVLRAQGLGVPAPQLPLLWAALHVSRSMLSWPLGRAADRLGRKRALIAGWVWYALCYAGFAAANAPAQMWILFPAYGLVAGLTEGSERALIASAVAKERRGNALGVYNLVSGAGLLIASVLAGFLWDRVAPSAALGTGAALALLAAALLAPQRTLG
jgi:MFS family permease